MDVDVAASVVDDEAVTLEVIVTIDGKLAICGTADDDDALRGVKVDKGDAVESDAAEDEEMVEVELPSSCTSRLSTTKLVLRLALPNAKMDAHPISTPICLSSCAPRVLDLRSALSP